MKKRLFGIVVLFLFVVLAFGCSHNEEEYFIFQGMNNEWSIEIPNTFEKQNEEKQENFYFVTYKNKNGDMFSINEVVDKETLINEEVFEKELGEDSYFHIQRVQTLNIESLGNVYYTLIEDHASEGYMIYFKMRINDKIISFVASKNKPFSVDDEAKLISMISNIKVN